MFRCPIKVKRLYYCGLSQIYMVAEKSGKIYTSLRNPKIFMPAITFPKFIDVFAKTDVFARETGEDIVAILTRNGKITLCENDPRTAIKKTAQLPICAKSVVVVEKCICVLAQKQTLIWINDEFEIIWKSEARAKAIDKVGR